MNDKILFGLIGLVVGALIMGGITTSTSTKTPSRTNNTTVKNSDMLDAHFIEQMIPHHEDAITMAKLAATRAEHEEIKTLATNIIDSQGKEIAQMKSWYKEWFGRELPTGTEVMMHHGMMSSNSSMHMGMMGSEQDMEKLENADNFDKEFIYGMIPHHQMAVMMANMLKDGTTRPEMKKLAEDIINAQTKEIQEMRTWYQEWRY